MKDVEELCKVNDYRVSITIDLDISPYSAGLWELVNKPYPEKTPLKFKEYDNLYVDNIETTIDKRIIVTLKKRYEM